MSKQRFSDYIFTKESHFRCKQISSSTNYKLEQQAQILQKTKWRENEFRGLTLQETDQLLPKSIDISVAPTLKKGKMFPSVSMS
jgi:K+/H+ antiporter YhaU regulatory subunit KhtT